MINRIIPVIGMFALAGCSALAPTRPPVTLYALHAMSPQQEEKSDLGGPVGVLRIEDPLLPSGLDSDRIGLFIADGRQLDYYAGAKWSAPLDGVLQNLMIDEARNVFPRMTVDSSSLKVAADYRLLVRFRDFAPFYQNSTQSIPFLKVAATFTLVRAPENTVITNFTLESGQVAASNSMTSVTSGLEILLQKMMGKALNQISEDLIEHQ